MHVYYKIINAICGVMKLYSCSYCVKRNYNTFDHLR